MNQMEIFKNPEFGSIRVIEENGKYLFCGTDVAAALGYSNSRDAIIRHCRYVVKRDAPHPQSPDRKISMTFIPEGDLYRLIVHSKLPSAEQFEQWVFDEVLPTIRKHGAYLTREKLWEVATSPEALMKLCSDLLAEREANISLRKENAQLEPYRIKVLNTINFKKSMHYNPFAYIHSEKDILKLVTTLIANTKGEGKAGDDFWVKAETLLYCALIGYIHYEAPVEEQNFSTLIEFINAMEVREDDEEFKNPVDLMFDALEAEKPNHFAVRQYKKYKLAAGKTAKSILISCGARLAVFDIAELREVTAYDELELDTLGDRKTALFLIMSDTDDSFNFLISMCYTQLFNLLCEKADDVYGGRLPVHVRCLIDECANIGQIPKLEKLVATIRSREISACLVLQAQSQLKAIYKDNADTIIGNMDTSIFLGGKEPTTLKELAAVLGNYLWQR